MRVNGNSMGEEIAISLKNVSKCFKRYARPVDRLKEILLPGKSYAQEFWALRDINLDICKGETFGIIGQNGSGKSTLLQIIARTLTPTTGQVLVNGRVSALLELGSGFNPEFTGRQNVFFNGRILGLSQEDIENKFDDIAAFADIGDFIDQPVKTYSSGMFVRLAFAVAVNVEPDILIVDEALAVGDGIFVHKCMAKIRGFQDENKTIILVSHDTGSITRICTQTMWICDGKIAFMNSPQVVVNTYQAWIYEKINKLEDNKCSPIQKETLQIHPNYDRLRIEDLLKSKTNPYTKKSYIAFGSSQRFGTGRAEIMRLELFNEKQQDLRLIYPNEKLEICIKVVCYDCIQKPTVGIVILDKLRTVIAAWNTNEFDNQPKTCYADDILTVKFSFSWPHLYPNSYSFDVAIADGSQNNHEMLDWVQNAQLIKTATVSEMFGLLKIPNTKVEYNYAN